MTRVWNVLLGVKDALRPHLPADVDIVVTPDFECYVEKNSSDRSAVLMMGPLLESGEFTAKSVERCVYLMLELVQDFCIEELADDWPASPSGRYSLPEVRTRDGSFIYGYMKDEVWILRVGEYRWP